MPTLTWIGKDKVVNHHLEVPYRVLEHKYGFRAEDDGDRTPTGSGNRIIHGDNLEALKSLLPKYEGGVKCIYIDPPYNTGNEKWVYNDNVNDPKIRKWLGEVVGKPGEDFSRHDKWLCMMYPRLKLLEQLLAEGGAIFISIDDNELANLKLLCDEVFGVNNFIDIFSWVKTETPANLSYKTKKSIEYIVCYQKNRNDTKFRGLEKESKSSNGLMNQTNALKELIFPANTVDTGLADGIYTAGSYGTDSYDITLLEDAKVKNGIFTTPIRLLGKFKWSQSNLDKEIANGTRISIRTKAFSPSYEKASYEPEVPWNMINRSFGVDTNEVASAILTTIFGKKVFDFPKPATLISYLINFVCSPDSIILDSFAGSGTTAHAVLNLNKKDGGNRKFILVEMEDYAEDITAERVRRVMRGYGEGKNAVAGTGGAFDYYELGEPMFNDDKKLNENIAEEEIREYIYYTETKHPLERKRTEAAKYLLDIYHATGYYFYYEKDCLTTLSIDTLNIITEQAEQYVVYADVCTVPKQVLDSRNIEFKQIPRDIKRF